MTQNDMKRNDSKWRGMTQMAGVAQRRNEVWHGLRWRAAMRDVMACETGVTPAISLWGSVGCCSLAVVR